MTLQAHNTIQTLIMFLFLTALAAFDGPWWVAFVTLLNVFLVYDASRHADRRPYDL